MNCDCLQKLEKAFEEMAPDAQEKISPAKGYKITSSSCQSLKLSLGGGKLTRRLFIGFRLNWKCDGKKDRSTESSVIASHCPMCGKELE